MPHAAQHDAPGVSGHASQRFKAHPQTQLARTIKSRPASTPTCAQITSSAPGEKPRCLDPARRRIWRAGCSPGCMRLGPSRCASGTTRRGDLLQEAAEHAFVRRHRAPARRRRRRYRERPEGAAQCHRPREPASRDVDEVDNNDPHTIDRPPHSARPGHLTAWALQARKMLGEKVEPPRGIEPRTHALRKPSVPAHPGSVGACVHTIRLRVLGKLPRDPVVRTTSDVTTMRNPAQDQRPRRAG